MIEEFRNLAKYFESIEAPMPNMTVTSSAMMRIAWEMDKHRILDQADKRFYPPTKIQLFGITITAAS